MTRLRLCVAYHGTGYAGWQLQSCAGPAHPPTVQGAVEKAAAAILGLERLPVFASSRTDSGVHAEGQICHLDVPDEAVRINWLRTMNSRLPEDIRVVEAGPAPAGFHARKNVLSKTYSYALWAGHSHPLPRIAPFVAAVAPLDFARIDAALHFLEGTRDWACMQNTGATPMKTTVRTVFSVTRRPHMAGPLRCPEDWPVCDFLVTGSGFLKQMVRNMVGLLFWVGMGKISGDEIPALLQKPRREDIPSPTAPAAGLTLMRIDYAEPLGEPLEGNSPS